MFCVLDGVQLVDPGPEIVWVSPEGDLQRLQELVHTIQQGLGPVERTNVTYNTQLAEHLKGNFGLLRGYVTKLVAVLWHSQLTC